MNKLDRDNLILKLHNHGSMNQTEIADLLGVDKSTVSRVIASRIAPAEQVFFQALEDIMSGKDILAIASQETIVDANTLAKAIQDNFLTDKEQ